MSEHDPNTSCRILLADDNEDNRRLSLRQLKRLGYEADAVCNGAEALSLLVTDSKYDLVLMDCLMPEMDGYTASEELRRMEGTHRHTVIIALTASNTDEDRTHCFASGMDDYIAKPIRIDTLKSALEHWLPPRQPANSGL